MNFQEVLNYFMLVIIVMLVVMLVFIFWNSSGLSSDHTRNFWPIQGRPMKSRGLALACDGTDTYTPHWKVCLYCMVFKWCSKYTNGPWKSKDSPPLWLCSCLISIHATKQAKCLKILLYIIAMSSILKSHHQRETKIRKIKFKTYGWDINDMF